MKPVSLSMRLGLTVSIMGAVLGSVRKPKKYDFL